MAGVRFARFTPALVAVAFGIGGCSAVTSASPTDTPTSAADASPSPSASESAATPSPSPTRTSAATASASPMAAPTFTRADAFGEAGWMTQVVDVEYWDDRFVALSIRTEVMSDRREVHLWTSADGTSWTSERVELGGSPTMVSSLLPLGDGSLAILGVVHDSTGEVGNRFLAWRSSDLVAWELDSLGMPADQTPQVVAVGPGGYVGLVAGDLHFSTDGLRWELVQAAADGSFVDVRAGTEGFVAVGTTDESVPFAFASGDGRSWFEADWGSEPAVSLSAIGGGDWMAVVGERDFELRSSADGLEWSTTTTLADLAGVTSGVGIDTEVTRTLAVGEGTDVYLTLAWDHCCVELSGSRGVWWSSDGARWAPLDLGDAVVQAAATDGERMVLAGFVDRGASGALWVSN